MVPRNIISTLTITIVLAASAAVAEPASPFTRPQTSTITSIWSAEKNPVFREKIADIVNHIDQTYACLYDNLRKGGKLVIFFDPAHGKLKNGQWQGGDATRRSSCTNLPEEYYSIGISRKMYEHLSKNSFIEVKTTDDFLEVLKGKATRTGTFLSAPRSRLAERAGAFIIIAEHLNNISVFYKADGKVNLPGIHVTRNGYGGRSSSSYVTPMKGSSRSTTSSTPAAFPTSTP